jgi:hypothetical protein
LTCESASYVGFWQMEIALEPGQTLSAEAQIKIADDHSAYAPRLEIIDGVVDPVANAGHSALDSDSVATPSGSGNWQPVAVSWQNTGSVPRRVLLRVSARHASGDVFFGVDVLQPMIPGQATGSLTLTKESGANSSLVSTSPNRRPVLTAI